MNDDARDCPAAGSILASRRILVVGTARNSEETIRSDVLRLRGSLSDCLDLSWLVVESDSSDGTVRELQVISKDIPKFRFVSLGRLKESLPLRTQRIAHCRNVYLEELQADPLYAETEYVIVADLDGANPLINADAFRSCWER